MVDINNGGQLRQVERDALLAEDEGRRLASLEEGLASIRQ
jgi:hypothetical protein